MTDSPTEDEEERWCAARRNEVFDYLAAEGLRFGEVGQWPAWHIVPYVSVWPVESAEQPGWASWWVVSGDFPTDYMICRGERHPRQALRDIGQRWQRAAAKWRVGEPVDGIRLGKSGQERQLAPLLASRAELFLNFAADDEVWAE